jgi:hypothetical protein
MDPTENAEPVFAGVVTAEPAQSADMSANYAPSSSAFTGTPPPPCNEQLYRACCPMCAVAGHEGDCTQNTFMACGGCGCWVTQKWQPSAQTATDPAAMVEATLKLKAASFLALVLTLALPIATVTISIPGMTIVGKTIPGQSITSSYYFHQFCVSGSCASGAVNSTASAGTAFWVFLFLTTLLESGLHAARRFANKEVHAAYNYALSEKILLAQAAQALLVFVIAICFWTFDLSASGTPFAGLWFSAINAVLCGVIWAITCKAAKISPSGGASAKVASATPGAD